MTGKKWIPPVKQGALHRQLGVPQGTNISKQTLSDVAHADISRHIHGVTVTPLLKKRVQFAINVRGKK
jgi:hypothetical protein